MDDDEEDPLASNKQDKEKRKSKRQGNKPEKAEEAKETEESSTSKTDSGESDGVDKLISFDSSPTDEECGAETNKHLGNQDLLTGPLNGSDPNSPGFGDYTETKDNSDGKNIYRCKISDVENFGVLL